MLSADAAVAANLLVIRVATLSVGSSATAEWSGCPDALRSSEEQSGISDPGSGSPGAVGVWVSPDRAPEAAANVETTGGSDAALGGNAAATSDRAERMGLAFCSFRSIASPGLRFRVCLAFGSRPDNSTPSSAALSGEGSATAKPPGCPDASGSPEVRSGWSDAELSIGAVGTASPEVRSK